jgi:hypothetical protein
LRKFLARFVDHFCGAVDPYDFGAACGNFGGEGPGSTSEIENALAGFRREQLQDAFRFLPNERMLCVVQTGVPFFLAHPMAPFEIQGVALAVACTAR